MPGQAYQTFNLKPVDYLKENMFYGQNVNVSRYDQQKHGVFEKLIEKQLSFFWRPEEIDLTQDYKDFVGLSEAEQHIFLSNLKYQTLLDSVAARSVSMMFLPIVSIPELETWFETHAFAETIHSRSYTHIIRNIVRDTAAVFDSIVIDPAIIKRAVAITACFDKFIGMNNCYFANGLDSIYEHKDADGVVVERIRVTMRSLKKQLLRCITAVNILEGIRFYVSFTCSFAFSELSKMEGNAKIVGLIARDEQLHLNGTQSIINIVRSGRDDPELKELWEELEEETIEEFRLASQIEKDWGEHLFGMGSMIGLNLEIICDTVNYFTNIRMADIGLKPLFEEKGNPVPWINHHLKSDNVQVAPQEAEIRSYLVGQLDSSISSDDFAGEEL